MEPNDEPTFSDSAKAELARLSDEAKTLVAHTIQSAAGLVVGELAVTRGHVIAISQRFEAFFGAEAAPSPLEQERDALALQVKTLTESNAAFSAQVADLTAKLAAATPAAPSVAPDPSPAQPAESNVPAPAADPLAPPATPS